MTLFLRVLLLLFLAGQAWGGCFPSFPNFGRWPENCNEWWNNSSLTFWAPFNDVTNPLKLNKGTGSLTFVRNTKAMYTHPTTGLITQADNNILRIESNGALIEGQRTNILTYSRTLSNAAWILANATADNTITGEDGVASSASWVAASGSNGTACQSVTIASAAYSGAFSLKRITGTGTVKISLDNGATYGSDLAASLSTSAWYRGSKANQTLANPTICLQLGTSGDNVAVDYAQVEEGAFVSSRITTVAAAVTRNADVLTMSASGNMSGSVGTVSFTWTPSFASTDSVLYSTIYDAGDIKSYYWSTDRKVYFTDGTDTSTTSALTFSSSTSSKFADRWTGSSAVLGSNVYLGSSSFGTNYLFGHLKSVRTWNRYFSDSEMTSISQ